MDETRSEFTQEEKLLHISLYSSGRIFQLIEVRAPSEVTGELFFLCRAGWFILELNPGPKQMHHALSSSNHQLEGASGSAQSSDLIVNVQSIPQSGNKESSNQKT